MYLRHSTVRKDGKTHTYWRLVRSVRRGSKVIQRELRIRYVVRPDPSQAFLLDRLNLRLPQRLRAVPFVVGM
jgi:hypothetical protein